MEKFELHILGCGSALPTTRHFPTSQILNVRDKLFMIDCGEGAQLQFRKSRLKFSRLNHIFISHLHGDHCFGLLGLISTLNLLGRTAELHIHSPQGLEELMKPMLDFFNRQMTYAVVFHAFDTREPSVVYEDRSLTVTTIPLRHRMPTCGFLFAEKPSPRHIVREMVDFYEVPVYELNRIKNGADYVTPDGEVIANERLTRRGAGEGSGPVVSRSHLCRGRRSPCQGNLPYHRGAGGRHCPRGRREASAGGPLLGTQRQRRPVAGAGPRRLS